MALETNTTKLGLMSIYKLLGFGVGGVGFILSISFGIAGFYLGWTDVKPEFLILVIISMVLSFMLAIFGTLMNFFKKERRNGREHLERLKQLDIEYKKIELAIEDNKMLLLNKGDD